MPISGFTPHYDWTSVDHIVDRRRPCDADVMGDWQGRTATGALSVCDMVPTTPTFSELATFGGVNESFYAHQQWTRCRSGGLQEIPLGLHDRSQKTQLYLRYLVCQLPHTIIRFLLCNGPKRFSAIMVRKTALQSEIHQKQCISGASGGFFQAKQKLKDNCCNCCKINKTNKATKCHCFLYKRESSGRRKGRNYHNEICELFGIWGSSDPKTYP